MNALQEKLDLIMREIYENEVKAMYRGFQPTDIWLGPDEYRVIEVAKQCDYWSHGSRIVSKKESDEITIRGMKIRKSVEPGIRVGVSFPLEDPSVNIIPHRRYFEG